MLLSHIKKFGLVGMLPPPAQKRLLAISRQGDFGPGERIFSRADAADHMFVVIRGRVKIFLSGGGRRRKTFAYLGAGDFFGEMAVITGKTRSASAEAVEPTSLLLIHKKDFRSLMEKDRKLAFYLLQAVSERLRVADEEIEDLLFRNVLGRVAKTLRDLSKGVPGNGPVELPRRYTHQDLADMVGTTREPLSRALATLRRAGLVDQREGVLVLLEPAKMDQIISASVATE
ncbi:MAG: CRP/FNR family transcriptional regulator, cyclic AMP receptor protein [Elusimicrobia bacterium]|nr:MAG: CRP/FNR family transcriptional regulator, cyclic AMP receptor protein [Elusimicrobiota bacterium]